jgi:peptide/nickel transport system substrate-binding protein
MSVTFKLRSDAKFHDGTPVTANDVKWSFDRAVTVGGFPTFQMAAGYFFYWAYHGQNAIFNTMSYQNPALDKLIEAARFETDPQKYAEEVEGFIGIAFAEVPRIPLFQPSLEVAMQQYISGYRYWFHRQLDYRPLAKA